MRPFGLALRETASVTPGASNQAIYLSEHYGIWHRQKGQHRALVGVIEETCFAALPENCRPAFGFRLIVLPYPAAERRERLSRMRDAQGV